MNGDNTALLTKILKAGDEITVRATGSAEIYFSDGSKSVIGENGVDSKVTLSKMNFVKENNLITKIALVVSGGSIWTKATHL